MDRPITHLFFGLLFGILTCVLYVFTNVYIMLFSTVIYLTILFKTLNKKFVWIILCYSFLGITTFSFYFNYSLPKNFTECRILEKRESYVIGEYGGRKIKIYNNIGNFEVGKMYTISGEFKNLPIYEKGIIGNFEVREIHKKREDFISNIYKLKSELFNKFNAKIGKYNTAILMGVCYGDSSYLSYDDMEEFNILGISHVISVSGLHTSLIYGALKCIVGYKIALIFLFIYVLFTGAEAATVRAFIMIVILVLAPKMRKKYDSISSLSFSAFILLLIKPYYILDVGYCLSFLGMLGIFLFYKKLKRIFYKVPMLINDSISLTIAASVFTVPYIMFVFKTYSIGGFISNLLVLPFYTFIVVIGNIALLVCKFEPIFNILTTMLSSLFFIVTTTQKFLLSIIPPPLNFTYMDGLALVMLHPIYMLIKRGYKSLIYMPIVLLILIMINNYKFFPEVRFINAGNYNIIAFKYKYNTFLISPEKIKLSRLYEKLFVNKLYDEIEEKEEIWIENKYKINVKKQGKELVLVFNDKYKDIIFLQEELNGSQANTPYINNSELFAGLTSKDVFLNNQKQNLENPLYYRSDNFPYAIIRVVKDKDKSLKGHFYKSYTIVMGNVLEGYIH